MAQECSVCGQIYGITHVCPGAIASSTVPADNRWIAPRGFSPVFYFRQAVAIARFDDAAIVSAARDPESVLYGLMFWLIGRTLIAIGLLRPRFSLGPTTTGTVWLTFAFAAAFIVILYGFLFVMQYGLAHGLAKWWFSAHGTLGQIYRAMLMGSVVFWLYPIPYIGTLVSSIWSIAILMKVFEEVDGIERMKAFALAAGVGAIFWIATLELLTSNR